MVSHRRSATRLSVLPVWRPFSTGRFLMSMFRVVRLDRPVTPLTPGELCALHSIDGRDRIVA
jgi:hypothetical protein